jgi:predicted TPR repeat methyltransferase
MIKDELPHTTRPFHVLDLGCGTGLSGAALIDAGINCQLHGVDLSQQMLTKAREKNIYTQLEHSDITSAMRHDRGNYDIILAEDVFIYVGKLDDAFSEIARLLNTNGLFAFSIEKTSGEAPFLLQASRRYAHHYDYIIRLIADYGFTLMRCNDVIVRNENAHPIEGYTMLARKI